MTDFQILQAGGLGIFLIGVMTLVISVIHLDEKSVRPMGYFITGVGLLWLIALHLST